MKKHATRWPNTELQTLRVMLLTGGHKSTLSMFTREACERWEPDVLDWRPRVLDWVVRLHVGERQLLLAWSRPDIAGCNPEWDEEQALLEHCDGIVFFATNFVGDSLTARAFSEFRRRYTELRTAYCPLVVQCLYTDESGVPCHQIDGIEWPGALRFVRKTDEPVSVTAIETVLEMIEKGHGRPEK